MFWVVSWCCGVREGWGWVSVSTVSSSVCHPLKGLPAQGSLLLLHASCCSVTLHLWLQGPFIIIQWLLHDNQWILHELLLIIIWLRPSPPALPVRLSRGIALGLWLKPHDSFPFFFSGKYLYIYVYKYIYPSRQPRKIQSTLQTKRNWLKMSTYCLSGPNFWNSRCLHLRFLFQIWISERPVLRHYSYVVKCRLSLCCVWYIQNTPAVPHSTAGRLRSKDAWRYCGQRLCSFPIKIGPPCRCKYLNVIQIGPFASIRSFGDTNDDWIMHCGKSQARILWETGLHQRPLEQPVMCPQGDDLVSPHCSMLWGAGVWGPVWKETGGGGAGKIWFGDLITQHGWLLMLPQHRGGSKQAQWSVKGISWEAQFSRHPPHRTPRD